jgi:cystathionine beta-lyase/cystathionine gamma-synthase
VSVVANAASDAVDDLVPEALADVRHDLEELLWLARSARSRLLRLDSALAQGELRPATGTELRAEARTLGTRFQFMATRLLALTRRATEAASAADLESLAGERDAHKDVLRALQSVLAALGSAADWQSPSFLSAAAPAAGLQAGQIVAHDNDYKRDRHIDAAAYERALVDQLHVHRSRVRALLTSCGMAALTTILSALRAEGGLARVVAGRDLYHETKELLAREQLGGLVFVDEGDTEALAGAIRAHEPTALFLDAIGNTAAAPLPDLRAACAALQRLGRATALVLDATGLASTGHVLTLVAGHPTVRPMVWESLIKYRQLGLDRVNAGMVVVRERDADAFSRAREHLGTNIADVAVHALPPPDRHVLDLRLGRLERNAGFLARRLEAEVARYTAGPFATVAHPGLPSHPAHTRALTLPFHGGCVSLAFGQGVELCWQELLLRRAIELARARAVPLVAGTSFGFDTARVYVTAVDGTHGDAFVRIAAGTEHRIALGRLAEVLADAVRDVGEAYASRR